MMPFSEPQLMFKSWEASKANYCVTSSLKSSLTAVLAKALFSLKWPGSVGHLMVCGHTTLWYLQNALALIRCMWKL